MRNFVAYEIMDKVYWGENIVETTHAERPQCNIRCSSSTSRVCRRGSRKSVSCDCPVDWASSSSDCERRKARIKYRTGELPVCRALAIEPKRRRIDSILPCCSRVKFEIDSHRLLTILSEDFLCALDIEGVVKGATMDCYGPVGT